MVKKRKIEWASDARVDLLDILEFYYRRNGNNVYSRKLYTQIQKAIGLISKRSLLGKQTDIQNVRYIIVQEYLIFYEILKDSILILTIWDGRRNPEGFKLIKSS